MPGVCPLKMCGYADSSVPGGASHSSVLRSPEDSFLNTAPSLVVGSHQVFWKRYSIFMSDICPIRVPLTCRAIIGTSSGLNNRRGYTPGAGTFEPSSPALNPVRSYSDFGAVGHSVSGPLRRASCSGVALT